MEIWDLYNEKREIIGEHIRGNKMPENGFHLVVHVWICNNRGQYLMTQRAAHKARYPFYWECVGGAVIKGETSLQGALREVEEEVGLLFKQEEAELLFSQLRTIEHGICYQDITDIYRIHYNGNVSLKKALTDEVRAVKWMTADEIRNLRENDLLIRDIKNLDYFFQHNI